MVTSRLGEVQLSIVCMQSLLFWSEEHSVSHRKHGADGHNLVNTFVGLRTNHGFGQLRVDRELSHLSSQPGEFSFVVESTESIQLFQGSHQGFVRRLVQEIESQQIVDSQALEHQRN